jgi:hypothetical protein
MKLEEMTTVKVIPPNKRERARTDYWNRNSASRRALKKCIQKCVDTGEQQIYHGDLDLFVIKPAFPLIESAMQDPENASLLKVSILVYHMAFHLGVRSGDEADTLKKDEKQSLMETAECSDEYSVQSSSKKIDSICFEHFLP